VALVRVGRDLASAERDADVFQHGERFRGEWWEEAAFAEAVASSGLRDRDGRSLSAEREMNSGRME
jgi:hypothetical protein